MPSVCFYFQVHQPCRLRAYSVFDIGRRHDYFDAQLDERLLARIADKCYRPMNRLLLELIDRHEGRFRCAFSVTGTVLEQLERSAPDVLESFRSLARTGCVEFLGESYFHSLAFLRSPEEFADQVEMHRCAIGELVGCRPTTFRNTELVYSDGLSETVASLGFDAMLAEGVERVLGWRAPNYVYRSATAPLRLLLKNYRLSDDIAFRFGDRAWQGYPLSAPKFAGWIHALNGCGEVVNLFMDYETFGEHQWAETGIFAFMRALPGEVLTHPDVDFVTPGEAVRRYAPADIVSMPEYVSWADTERDLTAWTGNAMQQAALARLYELRRAVLGSGDPELLSDWRRLTTSDHFYYMCTKWFADGDVHKYFSPYESPYEAHITFMNVLADVAGRAGVATSPASAPGAPRALPPLHDGIEGPAIPEDGASGRTDA